MMVLVNSNFRLPIKERTNQMATKKKAAVTHVPPSATGSIGPLVMLDPAIIMAKPEDNIRYKTLPSRVDRLAAQILDAGEIHTPIEVEPLPADYEERNGFEYRLTVGFGRHAAAMKLNTEQGAGLKLPAIIKTPVDALDRLKRQISENKDRENFNPIDEARAIQALLDSGVPKIEVCNIFARPTGKKGIAYAPASNSWVNMVRELLGFPKKIQDRIADGRIGLEAAHALFKKDKEKWDDILADIEAERIKKIEAEDKEEAKFLEAERKEAEAAEKDKAIHVAVDTTKATVDASEAALNAAIEAVEVATKKAADLYLKHGNAKKGTPEKDTLKKELAAAEESKKELEGTLAQAEKTHAANVKAFGKAKDTAEAAKKLAQERKDALDKKRKELDAKSKKPAVTGESAAAAPAKDTKPLTKKEIDAAAKRQGAEDAPVKLTAQQMREAVKSVIILSKQGSTKTIAIGQAFQQCFDGIINDGQLQMVIEKIVGEYKGK